MKQVLINDLVDVRLINKGIPNLLRVDHHNRPLATAIETTCAVDTHLARLVNTQFLTSLLGIATHRLGIEVLTAAAAILALVGAEKDVILIKTHRLYLQCSWGCRVDFARIIALSANHQSNRHLNAITHILAAADRCVMCGLCLPHCPTYQLHHTEAESPRGRIALMQALASGKLEKSPALSRHLDSCLVCRACEKMCPSKVPYGVLIDTTRGLLRARGGLASPVVSRLLEQVADKEKLQRSASLLRGYQKSGIQKLVRHSGLLKAIGLDKSEASLPTLPPQQQLAEHYPAQGDQHGRVGLFTGCIGSLLEGEVHRAAIELLSRLGYAVHIPASQGCCGSLHQHNGEPQKGGDLAKKNIDLFDGLKLDAVISTVSGCAAQLVEYTQSTTPFFEVCDFLLSSAWLETLTFRPLPQSALLHLPCSQRNVLHSPDSVAQLLQRIPQLVIAPLPENNLCCGSAGSYQLAQPANAELLRARKINHIENDKAQLLVSNNLGCALHLQDGLQQRGIEIEVIHPLLLLQRALP